MVEIEDVVGHEEILLHMRQAIKLKKVSHAYLLAGEAGSGKKLLANIFSKMLLCDLNKEDDVKIEGNNEGILDLFDTLSVKEVLPLEENGVQNTLNLPCNTCPSCRQFNSGNHPDVFFVKPSKKNGYGVDDIREQINQTMHVKPYQSRYKIYIIDQGDSMTVQAQNALLKTLEEPPSYGLFFLLAENVNQFLQTILSRCVVIPLKPVPTNKVEQYIREKLKLPDYQAKVISSFARGNIGKAVMLSSSEAFSLIREDVIRLMDVFIKGNDYDIMEAASVLEKYKEQIDEVLEILTSWVRDLLIVKKIQDEQYVIHQDQYKILLKQAQNLSYNRMSCLMNNIEKVHQQLKVNVNFQLAIEMMLLNASEAGA